MATRQGGCKSTDNALSVEIKRKRDAAIRAKEVAEYYRVEQLGDTQIFRVSHPQVEARSYLVNLYPGEEHCTCIAWREKTSCKHIISVQNQIKTGVLQCQQQT